jgi:hypothetical protein
MALSPAFRPEGNAMMVRIECTSCGHVGLADAQTLPRELRCWQCGSSRRVEAKGARRVASRTAVLEWLCGAEAPPARGAVEGRSRQHQK